MFCTFSLPNLFFATAACIFSTSELQKSASRRSDVQVFDVRTAKSAPRTEDRSFLTFHFKMWFSRSDLQFLIPLTTWLRIRRFNRPTIRLSRHTNHWENSISPLLYHLPRTYLLSFDFPTIASSFCWLDCSTLQLFFLFFCLDAAWLNGSLSGRSPFCQLKLSEKSQNYWKCVSK